MSDLVNFKLAQKLKEKGYPQHWSDNDYIVENEYEDNFEIGAYYDRCLIPEHIVTIAAPTISQVLKWLREKKDIFIGLEYINQEACGCTIIIQKTGGLIAKWNWDKFQYVDKNPLIGNTYEQAALAGIEYVLDNLI